MDPKTYFRNGASDQDDIVAVLRILEAVGAQGHAQKMVEIYCDRAMAAIDKLVLPPMAKNDLREVASFMAERSF